MNPSYASATVDTGGWLGIARRGLTPQKRREALLEFPSSFHHGGHHYISLEVMSTIAEHGPYHNANYDGKDSRRAVRRHHHFRTFRRRNRPARLRDPWNHGSEESAADHLRLAIGDLHDETDLSVFAEPAASNDCQDESWKLFVRYRLSDRFEHVEGPAIRLEVTARMRTRKPGRIFQVVKSCRCAATVM